MKNLYLPLAAALLLTACQTPPESTSEEGANMGAAIPGSAEDFMASTEDRVYFDFDKSNLTADAQATLQKQADWLKKYPHVAVVVEGHCDERGTVEYNLALGERRAVAAKNGLISAGVVGPESSARVGPHDEARPDRVRVVSYGKNRLPAGNGNDAATHARNRTAITKVE